MTDTQVDYSLQSADQPWSLTYPDSSTLRFELRPADHWANDYTTAVQRTEVAVDKTFYPNTPIEITYDFKVEPGPVTTADWTTIGQMHATSNGIPPYWMQILPGDQMEISLGYGTPANHIQFNPYLDPNPLIRGHTYSMKIDTNFADDSTGYLYVWRDGVQIVNYHGPIGFGDTMYWKEGIYRDVDAGNQTIAIDYSNLKIVTPTETDVLNGVTFTDTTGATGTETGSTGTDTGGTGTDAGTGTDTSTGTGDGNGTGTGTSAGGTDTGTGTSTGTGDGNGTGTGTSAGGTDTGTGTSTGTGDVNGTGTGTSAGGTDTGTGGTGAGAGDTVPPPENLVLTGGRGSDHLTGGDGNDQLYGAKGNDVLMGNSGNDLLSGGAGGDILMGGHGNDNINGGFGKDYVLLDGSMQDYTFAVTTRGVTVTDSTGEVDTVKNVEVFHFSDGTNYLVGRHGLVQTGDQTINSFLAASGVDQSLLGPVSTAQTQQAPVQSASPTSSNASVTGASVGSADPHPSTSVATAPTSPGTIPPVTQQHNESFGGITSDQLSAIFAQALNQAGHPQGVDKVLTNAALWNAVDAASNSPTHADSALTDLKQQLHDTFEHSGTTDTVDELAALIHWTHHE